MSKPRNPQKGTCPCPVKGCTHEVPVYTFTARSDDETRRRFAGRLYGDCPRHGRFGADGKEGMTEYFLENATLWRDGKNPAGDPAADSPENLQNPPVKAPAPAVSTPHQSMPAREREHEPRTPEGIAVWDL